MTKYTPDPLKSPDTITIARELSSQQIEIIKENNDLGGNVVAERLQKLRNVVWGSDRTKKPASEQQQKQVFDEVIKDLNPAQTEQLISSYAKMGHIYDIAALSARSNYIQDLKEKGKSTPGGVEEMIQENRSETVGNLVEKLNQPVFEVVMTAHPTNVNSLGSMNAQRELDKALEAVGEYKTSGNNNQGNLSGAFDKATKERLNENLTTALTKYLETPLLHQVEGADGKKQDANLTVRDETKTALYFLGNLYDDLPKAYKNYDDALTKHAKDSGSNYDKTALNLKTKFGSWGSSGDKDGNNNVTAESTLEAIALHTQAILMRYSEDLGKMDSAKAVKWKTNFDDALTTLQPLTKEIQQLVETGKKPQEDISPAELSHKFNRLSKRLATVRNKLDGNEFEKDLQSIANNDEKALNLLRRFRTFGFNFAKIEYRETAKEYDRVVGELVGKVSINGEKKEFQDLNPDQKMEKLTELLQQPNNEAAKLYEENKERIIQKGAGRAYTGKVKIKNKYGKEEERDNELSAKPIAYHTLKRMQLARDFGDMIKDNVLAECGQLEIKGRSPTEAETVAQGVANILEAQFLQKAVEKKVVEEKDGEQLTVVKRPTVGIVPLFEEPDTMAHIDKIMGAVYENKAYQQQIKAVQEANKTEKPTQQVMIAHSDNARRSGLQAARAYIHEAHLKIRELNSERKKAGKEEIQTQFYEGGSISDAYRNGVRAISASVNAFDLHDFAKFTFQGGDLLNYFNHPDSTARLIDRQISHQAKALAKTNGKDPKGEWVRNFDKEHISVNAANESFYETNNVINDVAIKALKKTLLDYQANDFTEKTMGVLLSALNYDKTVKDSNGGSRAGARGVVAAVVEAVEKTVKKVAEFVAIGIDKVRTIGFSKAWQGSGIVPSWLGSKTLKDNLSKAVSEKYEEIYDKPADKVTRAERDFVDNLALKNKQLDARQIRYIYKKSPTFRDAQDRSAFALALTDMDAATAIANKKLAANDNDSEKSMLNKRDGLQYLKRVQATYEEAAKLAYSSLEGQELKSSNLSNRQIRDKIINTKDFAPLKEDITNKTNYRAFLLHLQVKHPEMLEDAHLGRVAQSAKDTVEHGRWLAASDPTLAQHKAKNQSNGRVL